MRTTLQIIRFLVLIGLLLAAKPVGSRWTEAFTTIEYPALRWTWLGLAALAVAFLAVAVVARGRGQPRWLLAGEGVVAVVIAAVLVVPGLLGTFVGPGSGLLEPMGRVNEFAQDTVLTPGTVGYGRVLALAWVVIVVEAVVRHIRGSAPQSAATRS